MDWKNVDWALLHRLRSEFLSETPGHGGDYWESEKALEHYDLTFGARIGWKWAAVLEEAGKRGWRAPEGRPSIVDWGCGTGVASRKMLAFAGAEHFGAVVLHDRSRLARDFAAKRVRAEYPAIPVEPSESSPVPKERFVLLVSHVVNELGDEARARLVELARRAESVFWVEPGTPSASRRLIDIREKLRGEHAMLAPCPHGGTCGLLAPGNERHWCHHFAPPPPEVFRSAEWDRFSRELKIDRRSLPVSYLVTTRSAAPPSASRVRVLGRPRRYKGYVTYLGCDAAGVSDRRLLRKHAPELFEALEEDRFSHFIEEPEKD